MSEPFILLPPSSLPVTQRAGRRIGGDPIKLGIVRSLNRPAGNATGVYLFATDIEAKRLGLLRDLVPTSALIGVLLNPKPTPKPSQKTFRRQYAPSVRKFRSCTSVGRLPHGMGVARLADLSAEWSRQRQMLGLPVL